MLKYAEYSPSPTLARFVKCYWSLEGDAARGARRVERVLPDGCVELVLHLDHRRGSSLLGPHHEPAALVGTAQNQNGRRPDSMFLCEGLDLLVHDLSVLQAKNKDTTQRCF